MSATRLATFEAERSRLFGLAYRMVGVRADAEDIVQEAYLRWVDSPEAIDNPAAYLTTVTSRLAIDRLRSAQRTRETYVGPWLPEPLVGDEVADPADDVVMAESLTLAFLALLERLTPVERAVLLLHDVFGLPFDEVAESVDRSSDNCRQIARRARGHIDAERRRFEPPSNAASVIASFVDAVLAGNLATVEALLTEDCVHVSDGGGAVHAARRPVVGRDRVGRFYVNLAKRVPADEVDVRHLPVNGTPGVALVIGGHLAMVIGFEVVDGLIHSSQTVINPEKLAAIEID